MPAGATAPPPAVPLGFLAAAGVGMAAFGAALVGAAGALASGPTRPGALGAVHVGVLGFLTTAILGALHQFCPVVGSRRLRSVPLARLTLVLWVPAVTALPIG